MNFKEAYEKFLKGKKIRRNGWKNKDYYYMKLRCVECEENLSPEDALSEDWYVIEE